MQTIDHTTHWPLIMRLETRYICSHILYYAYHSDRIAYHPFRQNMWLIRLPIMNNHLSILIIKR